MRPRPSRGVRSPQVRVLTATLICALESVHGLPVYLVVLCMGLGSLALDFAASPAWTLDVRRATRAERAPHACTRPTRPRPRCAPVCTSPHVRGTCIAYVRAQVLRHMPWELFSFVTGFLVLAEAMAVTGISLWLASAFIPLAGSRSVAFVSGYVTMLFCNVFETLPATLIVFKMIDSVPQWKPEAIQLVAQTGGPLAAQLLKDARRAALSAVIFGSNFGANTACIGSLGGLMMRRLASQQGVTVTNYMLLKQGIPVMIPTMFVACWVLVHQQSI